VTLLADTKRPNNSRIPRGTGPDLPAWVAFDKQVLSFDAYYAEEVKQSYCVHRCKVLFYLEDDTMQVVEPRDNNSGLSQGTLLAPHKVSLSVCLSVYLSISICIYASAVFRPRSTRSYGATELAWGRNNTRSRQDL